MKDDYKSNKYEEMAAVVRMDYFDDQLSENSFYIVKVYSKWDDAEKEAIRLNNLNGSKGSV